MKNSHAVGHRPAQVMRYGLRLEQLRGEWTKQLETLDEKSTAVKIIADFQAASENIQRFILK